MTFDAIIEYFMTSPESYRETSGVSGAKTYFLDRDGGYYLKIWDAGKLKREYAALDFFRRYTSVPEIVGYRSCENGDYLVTRPLPGKSASDPTHLQKPEKLAAALGKILREFHDKNIPNCPFTNSAEDMLARAARNYQRGVYDEKLAAYIGESDIDHLYQYIVDHCKILKNDTVIHGDFCLPNILLDSDFHFTGYLDMGMAGNGDRHYDLFWGRWSLWYNLGTDRYGDVFYHHYGWDAIDFPRLKVIGCVSCMDA